jgi:hypothetical protein
VATNNRAKKEKFYSDPLEDYSDELTEDLDDEVDDDLLIGEDISQDFISADSEYICGESKQISARRKIERMNELKELYSQFDDWDDLDLGTEW